MQTKSVLETVRKLAETNVATVPSNFDEVQVKIDPDCKVLASYIEELFANLGSAIDQKGGSLGFTLEELKRYVSMVVKTRVDYVNGKRVEFRPTDVLVVPAYLSVVLESIGVVDHFELGLALKPSLEGITCEREFMTKMTRLLAGLGAVGLEYAKGYTREKTGSFDFMSMTLLDGVVKSHSKEAHPVNALLSATLGIRGIEAMLSPRVTYGTERHFEALVRHCATLKG